MEGLQPVNELPTARFGERTPDQQHVGDGKMTVLARLISRGIVQVHGAWSIERYRVNNRACSVEHSSYFIIFQDSETSDALVSTIAKPEDTQDVASAAC